MAENNIQLLPETRKRIEVIRPGERRMLYISIAVLVLVTVLYFIMAYFVRGKENEVSDLKTQIVNMEKQRDAKFEAELFRVSRQLAVSSGIINNHTVLSLVLARLEKNIQPQVQLLDLSIDTSTNNIQISAQTTNFVSVAKQVANFLSDDGIEDLSLNRLKSLPSGRVDFSLMLKFNSAKFFSSQ